MEKSVKNIVAETLHGNRIKLMKNVQKGESMTDQRDKTLGIIRGENAENESENR